MDTIILFLRNVIFASDMHKPTNTGNNFNVENPTKAAGSKKRCIFESMCAKVKQFKFNFSETDQILDIVDQIADATNLSDDRRAELKLNLWRLYDLCAFGLIKVRSSEEKVVGSEQSRDFIGLIILNLKNDFELKRCIYSEKNE